jgi:hypothetical protein
MTNSKSFGNVAGLSGNDFDAPEASILTPDVRSGATFPFDARGWAVDGIAPFTVIWVYTVKVENRRDFAKAVDDFEDGLPDPASIKPDLVYRGTYSVSVSSAAPEFEYRTIWTLSKLANLDALNAAIGDAGNTKLQAIIKLIELRPPMRVEIMGLTRYTRSVVT